jgi:pimeloyl-ACP methyl ester carboxylesterase
VIDGVVSPLQNVADLSQETARALTLLRQQCQQSAECKAAFPQFELQLEALLARAAAKNTSIQFFHPRTGKKQQIPLSLASFGLSLQSMLYRPEMAGRLPWLVMQAAADNWQPFIANTFGGNGADGISIGLYLAVLCSEDIPYLTPAQMKIDPTMAGARWSQKILGSCPILKVAPRPRPATSIIQAPTLLLSGQRDPVTPPERAEEAMKYFSNGQHLISQQAGHIVTMQPCAAKLLRQFLDAPDKKVDGKCLSELLAAPFVVSDYGTQP